jgi:hypothetical protein
LFFSISQILIFLLLGQWRRVITFVEETAGITGKVYDYEKPYGKIH